MIISAEAVRELALTFLAGVDYKGKPPTWQEEELKAHYGSNSLVFAAQWFDVTFATQILKRQSLLKMKNQRKASSAT